MKEPHFLTPDGRITTKEILSIERQPAEHSPSDKAIALAMALLNCAKIATTHESKIEYAQSAVEVIQKHFPREFTSPDPVTSSVVNFKGIQTEGETPK